MSVSLSHFNEKTFQFDFKGLIPASPKKEFFNPSSLITPEQRITGLLSAPARAPRPTLPRGDSRALTKAKVLAHNLGSSDPSHSDISFQTLASSVLTTVQAKTSQDVQTAAALAPSTQEVEFELPKPDQQMFSLIDTQASFFTNCEPKVWFPLTKKGLAGLKLPNDISNGKRVIYIFENVINRSFLIGKTGSAFGVRLAVYQARAKHGKSEFFKDLKSDPTAFKVGILYQLKAGESGSEFETNFIKYKSTIYDSCYNQNKGGGGGSAHSEEVPKKVYVINPSKITPAKYYPAKLGKDGLISFQFTPGAYSTMNGADGKKLPKQGMVYCIKNLRAAKVKRYIGLSSNPIKRAGQHCCASKFFNHKNLRRFGVKKAGTVFHKAFGKNPNAFGIGFYPIHYEEPTQLTKKEKQKIVVVDTSSKLEKLFIQSKKTLVPHGLNMTVGGNGSIADQQNQKSNR